MEEENDKKFDLPEGILGTMIVGLSDVADVVGLATVGVPVIGQVIFAGSKVFSAVAGAGILFWLIIKDVRWIWFLSATVLDLLGMPFTQTAGFLLTIYLANHPGIAAAIQKTAVAAGAVAATVATGGAAAPVAGAAAVGAEAGAAGATTAGAAGAATGAAATAEVGTGSAAAVSGGEAASTSGAVGTGTSAGAPETAVKPGVSEEAFGVKPEPWERVRKVMEELPSPEARSDREEEEDEEENSPQVA